MVSELGVLVALVQRNAIRSQNKIYALPVLFMSENALARKENGESSARTFVFCVRFWTHPLFMTRSISKHPFWFTGAADVSRGKRLRRLGALFSQELRAARAASCGLAAPC